jgi:predicted nucleic acid-binding protein
MLPLDETAARLAGRFHALRDAAGLPSQPSDMMIAGLPVQIIDPWQEEAGFQ